MTSAKKSVTFCTSVKVERTSINQDAQNTTESRTFAVSFRSLIGDEAASWSFAGLGFLSLYLSGKLKAFDRKGHIAKLCIIFLPLLVASLVAVSRVDDYWHHWQDVFAEGLIGLVVATFCYLQFFPPHHPEGWGPYAYFKMLEESRGIGWGPYAYFKMLEESRGMAQGPISQNGSQAQSENQDGQSQHGCIGLFLAENQTSTLEDELESGRR